MRFVECQLATLSGYGFLLLSSHYRLDPYNFLDTTGHCITLPPLLDAIVRVVDHLDPL